MPKVYRGHRNGDSFDVWVNGEPLDPVDLFNSPYPEDFDWGYEGEAPLLLAGSILWSHTRNMEKSTATAREFMLQVIAKLPDEWQITDNEIDIFLENIERGRIQ